LFADLINAKPSEVAYVSSTSAGENLVVQALALVRRFDGNVVTDGLHFEGALLHLLELKKQGLDVRVVKPTKEYRIDFKDLEKVVDKKTKLIEVSSASMYNGFQHDLKKVCDLAHAHGAYVYADIIHSAGAEPFDVKATGVDFAACSTFKWLVGDFGLRFFFPGGGGAVRRQGDRRRLCRMLDVQVADGRLRHRLSLRARGSARPNSPSRDGLLPGTQSRAVLSAESAGRRVRAGDVRFSEERDRHVRERHADGWPGHQR